MCQQWATPFGWSRGLWGTPAGRCPFLAGDQGVGYAPATSIGAPSAAYTAGAGNIFRADLPRPADAA